MSHPVEIRSSGTGDPVSIPAENVAEVAEAFRQMRPTVPAMGRAAEKGEQSDEEVIAQALAYYARETVREYRRQQAIREALERADQEAQNDPF